MADEAAFDRMIKQLEDHGLSLEMQVADHKQEIEVLLNEMEVNGQDEVKDRNVIEILKLRLEKDLDDVNEIQRDKARVMALEKKSKSELKEVKKQLKRVTKTKRNRRGGYGNPARPRRAQRQGRGRL